MRHRSARLCVVFEQADEATFEERLNVYDEGEEAYHYGKGAIGPLLIRKEEQRRPLMALYFTGTICPAMRVYNLCRARPIHWSQG